jgi:2-hydroxycyclohexanecarboxyl-CoA dehydrogenase
LDISADRLEALGREFNGAVPTFRCDQTDEAAVRGTVEQIIAQVGPVDILVNTTGWAGTTRFEEEDSRYWRKIIAINLESALYVTSALLPHMVERKSGKFIFVGSDAGRVGTSGEAVYAATKAALGAFAKSLARENARHKLTFNVVSPGPTDTPLLQEEIAEKPELIERMAKLIPMRRLGQPEDIANAIAFFVSSDSDYITGQIMSVSGGLTMVD